MAFRTRTVVTEPAWPKPPFTAGEAGVVRSGNLSVSHAGAPGAVDVRVGNQLVARGLSRSLIGYSVADAAHWAQLPDRADVAPMARDSTKPPPAPTPTAHWRVRRRYRPGRVDGSVDVETVVSVDRDRELLFFPAFVLLPGAGWFGATKSQGLFCGLEYLGPGDASRSEADVSARRASRPRPQLDQGDSAADGGCAAGGVSRPVVGAAAARGGAVRLPRPHLRLRRSRHGPDPARLRRPRPNRRRAVPGSAAPPQGGSAPVTVKATILAGTGASVVPAIRQYVSLHGLPPVPDTRMDAAAYTRWAAGGWLDSKIREGQLVRHAVWPGFGAIPPPTPRCG